MSKKKKIILSVLCTISLFIFYEVWDWNVHRHWIGTTKDTEIVQKHLLPMEKYFPEGDWFLMCGDSPEDYFLVLTDFSLFGSGPTLKSGSCWTSADIWVDDNEKYIDTKIIPWLKKQGFTDIRVEKYGETDDVTINLGEMWVHVSPLVQKLDKEKGELEISFFVHAETDVTSYPDAPPGKSLVYINIGYSLQ